MTFTGEARSYSSSDPSRAGPSSVLTFPGRLFERQILHSAGLDRWCTVQSRPKLLSVCLLSLSLSLSLSPPPLSLSLSHTHTHKHTHTHTHTQTHTRARTRTHTHARTHMHARTHTHIHARARAHIHTHAHMRSPSLCCLPAFLSVCVFLPLCPVCEPRFLSHSP